MDDNEFMISSSVRCGGKTVPQPPLCDAFQNQDSKKSPRGQQGPFQGHPAVAAKTRVAGAHVEGKTYSRPQQTQKNQPAE
jgi:hypothetical protein